MHPPGAGCTEGRAAELWRDESGPGLVWRGFGAFGGRWLGRGFGRFGRFGPGALQFGGRCGLGVGRGLVGIGRRSLPGRDLRQRAPGHDRGFDIQQSRARTRLRVRIPLLDQQPARLALAGPGLDADQDPDTDHPVALHAEFQLTSGQISGSIEFLAVQDVGPCAAVPNNDGATAVLALGDRALERGVVDRVILDLDRQALLRRVRGRAARDSPGFEHSAKFKPQVVVQPGRGMFLHDELVRLDGGSGAGRLLGLLEITLGAIAGESVHLGQTAPDGTGCAHGRRSATDCKPLVNGPRSNPAGACPYSPL